MADYFSMLVGRTLSKTPTVRPLVASRYGMERWSTEEPAVEHRSIQRADGSGSFQISGELSSRPGDLPVKEKQPEAQQANQTSHRSDALEQAPRRLSRQEGSSEPGEAQLRRGRAEADDVASRTQSTEMLRETHEPSRTSHADQEWRLLPLAANRDTAELEAHSQGNPARPTTEIRAPHQQYLQEPPVVRVSIGRIDVRAVMPQVETAKPQPQQARRSSLEKYLRVRNGERG